MKRPPGVHDLRAAWWAWRALRDVRAQLAAGAVRQVRVGPPPAAVPARAGRAVRLVLDSSSPSCLERAFVLQRWMARHGTYRDVVIGTGGGRRDFEAHAWLDGQEQDDRYVEMLRIAP